MDQAAAGRAEAPGDSIRLAVVPPSPFRLPHLAGGDRAFRQNLGVSERLLVVDDAAVIARVSQPRPDHVVFEAEPVDPAEVSGSGSDRLAQAGEGQLEEAICRLRFATSVDDELGEMSKRFRDDPLIGQAVRSKLHVRRVRRPFAWEAFAWGVTEQLIEYRRATSIQRQTMFRWGMTARGLRAVPGPDVVAGLSPAELESAGLSARRSIALIRAAREVDRGRCVLEDPADDRRLLAVPEIGPWTIACLALHGRGDPDALLAGDLSHVKLVGYMKDLGRLATVEEVEEFYLPYAPWRGWAGNFMLGVHGAATHGAGSHQRIRRGPRRARAA